MTPGGPARAAAQDEEDVADRVEDQARAELVVDSAPACCQARHLVKAQRSRPAPSWPLKVPRPATGLQRSVPVASWITYVEDAARWTALSMAAPLPSKGNQGATTPTGH